MFVPSNSRIMSDLNRNFIYTYKKKIRRNRVIFRKVRFISCYLLDGGFGGTKEASKEAVIIHNNLIAGSIRT